MASITEYTPVLKSQTALEQLHHPQLEPHLPRDLFPPNSYQDSHHYQHQHHHQHLHHNLHFQTAMVGYQDMCDNMNVGEVSPVSFGAQSFSGKEKHGQPQDQCMSRKSSPDALFAAEDTRFLHRTYEDSLYSPTQNKTVQFVREGMYSHHQPFSSTNPAQPRVKLLCSIGGKIMARPVDGRLRYCGGETRIIAIDRGLCFTELMAKIIHIYGFPLTLKYQLPGEDLDALVSVSSDDDLQNMLDEYEKLVTSSGNSWLRAFLFTPSLQCENISPCDHGHEMKDFCANVMQEYIDAINGHVNNGVMEQLADGHLDNGVNNHHLHQKMPVDSPNNTPSGTCFSKPTLRPSSSPPSAPASPSVAAMQAQHKLCGTGDFCSQFLKDQSNCIAPKNSHDISTREVSHGVYMDASCTLKCDHQNYMSVESPGGQQDTPFSRGDAMWGKDGEAHSGDPQETLMHKREFHPGSAVLFMDTWHDNQKPCGLTNSPCEDLCGHHLATQPLALLARQRQMEDNFGRVDSFQHYKSEGRKQPPVHYQSHQAIPPLHREARLQRGLGYDLSCQNADGQGLSPFTQEFKHPYAQNAHVMGTNPVHTMGSAPSSPQDFVHGRCSCCREHPLVHRGISVSLGEQTRPFHAGEQYVRKHDLPLLSRFCDSSSVSTDSAVWHYPPNLGKGSELDEQDQVRCLGEHNSNRSKSRHHLLDCHAKESATYYGDSHGLMDPLHGHHEWGVHQGCFADYYDHKGQHVETARAFPAMSKLQSHLGECASYPRSSELDPAHVFTAENLTHVMPSQDHTGVSNIERFHDGRIGLYSNHGQGALETGMPCVCDGGNASILKSSHVSTGTSTLGSKEPDCDLNSMQFSSTDAVAGSLSRASLEPPIWVGAPSLAGNGKLSEEGSVYKAVPAIDCTASSMHLVDGSYSFDKISSGALTGKSFNNPSFRCVESYARDGSDVTSNGAREPSLEHSSIPSVNHVLKHSVDNASASYARESRSEIDHSGSFGPSQPFLSRTLDLVCSDGSAVALTPPAYDHSLASSIDNATFLFAQGEGVPVVNGALGDKEATSQICVVEPCRTSSILNSHSNDKQHYTCGKGEADIVQQETCEQEIQAVSEGSRALLQPSSINGAEKGVYCDGQEPKDVPTAQSEVSSEIVQEEKVSVLVSPCIKEEETELPATQAEAEAIARGLQIIRNDDLEDLKELGTGTYGTVYHGKWRGSDVAIKRIKATCFMGHPSVQERLMSDFWKEAGTLSQLHHPNVVAFYGVVPDGPEGTLATVTEYMVNGSLRQVLVRKDRTIDRKKRLLIAMDAAFGMEYLHSKRIVHFDLKSENLLVNMRDAHRPICKVGDLGLSKVKRRTLVSGGVRGTLPWMAPELLSGDNLVTEKVDVYSFGIVMWELLSGEDPYANMHCGTIIGGIVNNTLRPPIPCWCDPSWRELMEKCWSGNPADRPGFSVVASELRAIAMSMNIK